MGPRVRWLEKFGDHCSNLCHKSACYVARTPSFRNSGIGRERSVTSLTRNQVIWRESNIPVILTAQRSLGPGILDPYKQGAKVYPDNRKKNALRIAWVEKKQQNAKLKHNKIPSNVNCTIGADKYPTCDIRNKTAVCVSWPGFRGPVDVQSTFYLPYIPTGRDSSLFCFHDCNWRICLRQWRATLPSRWLRNYKKWSRFGPGTAPNKFATTCRFDLSLEKCCVTYETDTFRTEKCMVV